MGLTLNNSLVGGTVSLSGAREGGLSRGMAGSIRYAMAFGRGQSVPQGYNSPSALRMPVTSQGYIAARARGDAAMTASLSAYGNMAALLQGEADMVAAANVLLNGYATFAGEADLVAELTAIGNMAANMDILARPSANDVAQEVWAFINSGDTTGAQLLKALKAAKLAAALSA